MRFLKVSLDEQQVSYVAVNLISGISYRSGNVRVFVVGGPPDGIIVDRNLHASADSLLAAVDELETAWKAGPSGSGDSQKKPKGG